MSILKVRKPSVLKALKSFDAVEGGALGIGAGLTASPLVYAGGSLATELFSSSKNKAFNKYVRELNSKSSLSVKEIASLGKIGREKGLKGRKLYQFIDAGRQYKKAKVMSEMGPPPPRYTPDDDRMVGAALLGTPAVGGLIGAGIGASKNYAKQVKMAKNVEKLNKALNVAGGVSLAGLASIPAMKYRKGKEKTAGALRSRAIESLIGAAGGAAGGAYGEKKTRKVDEFGSPQTSKDRKIQYIAGGALAGALGVGTGSKMKRMLKKRRVRKDYDASMKELGKAVQDTKDNLKNSGLSPIRHKKGRKIAKGEELLKKMRDSRDTELAKDYKRIDSSLFGGKKIHKKGDKDFYKNLIQEASRMKDSL